MNSLILGDAPFSRGQRIWDNRPKPLLGANQKCVDCWHAWMSSSFEQVLKYSNSDVRVHGDA